MPNGSYLDMSFISSLQSRSIAIIGGGVTGAGINSFLQSHGLTAVIVDEKESEISGVRSVTAAPSGVDLAIVSPGWKKSHPVIESLSQSGAEIISEIDFSWRIKNEVAPLQKWIALTGTNGKTTSIQMVDSIFKAAGIHGVSCGNIGDTVISSLLKEKPYDFLAIELSSFQIEWSEEAQFEACAVLNIAEDHIDWHGSFDAYANSKMSLLGFSTIAVLNADDPEIVTRSTGWNGKKVFYSLETPGAGELGLVENLLVDRAFISPSGEAQVLAELEDIKPTVPHNVSNALAAAGLARAIGISYEHIKNGLSAFVVDHHRIEVVLVKDGITWVNDSKATNPHAAIASILSHEKVVWIAGGLAKGASMDRLVQRAAPRLSAAILIGTDRDLIESALTQFAPHVPVVLIDNEKTPDLLMAKIVSSAQKLAQQGEAVLLAPACASMDQFRSYAHRGDLFASTVRSQVGK